MRNLLSMVAAVGAAVVVLSGCAAPGAAESSDGHVTLTFMRTGTPEQLHPLFDPMIEEFEKQNPNISIDMQDLGWADSTASIGVMAASKSLPDVMYQIPTTIFDMAQKGLVLDLSDRLDDELREDIYPALLEGGQFQGKQYMITAAASPLVFWYNAKLFEEAGLDPDNPPATWADFLTAEKAIKDKTGVPGLGLYSKPALGETSLLFESLFASEIGGPSWDPATNQYTYDQPENEEAAVRTLQFIKDMVPDTQPNLVEYGRFDTRTLLRDGKVGMVLDGVNMIGQVQDLVDDGTIRVAPIPAGSSGKSVSALNIGGFFIPSNSEHPDEAWKFLRFMMTTDNQTAHSSYGSAPVLKSEAAGYEGAYWEVLQKAVLTGVPEGVSDKSGTLWKTNAEQLQALLTTDQSPETTLKNITREHNEAY